MLPPARPVQVEEVSVSEDYYLYGTDVIQCLNQTIGDLQFSYETTVDERTPSEIEKAYEEQAPVLHIHYDNIGTKDQTYEITTTDAVNSFENPILSGHGSPEDISVRDVASTIIGKDLDWMNKALCFTDEQHAVMTQMVNPLSSRLPSGTTMQATSFPYTHPALLAEIETLNINSMEMLKEFTENEEYFTSLKNLTINPIYTEQFKTGETIDLHIPPSVKNLQVYNSNVSSITFDVRGHPETVRIHHNLQLQSINGFDSIKGMKEVLLGDIPADPQFSYGRLRENNPDAQIFINIMDLAKDQRTEDIEKICRDDKAELFENLGGSIMLYNDETIWKEVDEAADSWIKKNIVRGMSDEEKLMAVYNHFQEDIRYPADYKYVETHSLASAFLDKKGVCENKAKGMAYVLNKMGFDAQPVYCDLSTLGVEQKSEDKIRLMDSTSVINHVVVRITDEDEKSIYFDPTFHKSFISKEEMSNKEVQQGVPVYTFPVCEGGKAEEKSYTDEQRTALSSRLASYQSRIGKDRERSGYKLDDDYLYVENVGKMKIYYAPTTSAKKEMHRDMAREIVNAIPHIIEEKIKDVKGIEKEEEPNLFGKLQSIVFAYEGKLGLKEREEARKDAGYAFLTQLPLETGKDVAIKGIDEESIELPNNFEYDMEL